MNATAENAAYENIGRKLRDARLSYKIEVQDVASVLHIRPRYLQALEDGVLEILPGDTFATGYLTRYAAFLGLDAAECLAAYRHAGALPAPRFFTIPDSLRRRQHPSRRLVMLTLMSVVLLSLFWLSQQEPPLARAWRIAPPPYDLAQGPIRTPRCMAERIPVWPPCYYLETQVTIPGVVKPVRNMMELYRP